MNLYPRLLSLPFHIHSHKYNSHSDPPSFLPLPARTCTFSLCFQCQHAGVLSTIPLSRADISPMGIAATPSGVLIVTCNQTHSVYAIDPFTGHCNRFRGSHMIYIPKLMKLQEAVAVVDNDCCAYVCDNLFAIIRRITLPPQYFQTRTSVLRLPHALFSVH